jgi:tRNA(fMet)-specific endonuclease VapC
MAFGNEQISNATKAIALVSAPQVLGELWSGIAGSSNQQRNTSRLRHGLSRLILWPYDLAAAEQFGRIFAELKRVGRPMQQIDIQIAAIAFALGNCTVVTEDSDFVAIPGLAIENWANQHPCSNSSHAKKGRAIILQPSPS